VVTGLSLGCSRALRAFALTLGLVALTLQGLAPLCLNMTGAPSVSASGYSIIICTVHGYQTIQIGADGKPAPNAPAQPDAISHVRLLASIGVSLMGSSRMSLIRVNPRL